MEDLIKFLTSQELQNAFFPLKILFLSFSLFLFISRIYILSKTGFSEYSFKASFQEFKSFKTFEAVEFVKKWKKTKMRLAKGWESEAKLAIIEADNLLNELLKRIGYQGENFNERLKQLDKNILANIDQVWEAHKIRNDI